MISPISWNFSRKESLRLGRQCRGCNLVSKRVEPAPDIVRRPALGEQGKKSLPCPERNAGEIFVEKQFDVVVHRISAGKTSEVATYVLFRAV